MTIVAGLRKQRDDNYGTSSLSELASALGVGTCQSIVDTSQLYKVLHVNDYMSGTILLSFSRNDGEHFYSVDSIYVGKTSTITRTKGVHLVAPGTQSYKVYHDESDVYVKATEAGHGEIINIISPQRITQSSIDVSTLTEITFGQ